MPVTSFGGKDGIPKPPEFLKLQSDIVNKTQNNIPAYQELKALNVASLGSGWVKLHPESLEGFENITSFQQMKPGVNPETLKNQANLVVWEDTDWSGACDAEAKFTKPTLVIAGTDDNNYMPHGNALKLAGKDSRSLACTDKDVGHAVMIQYPAEIGKILNTFLSTTSPNN